MDLADQLFLLMWIAPLVVGLIAGCVFIWRTRRSPPEEWRERRD